MRQDVIDRLVTAAQKGMAEEAAGTSSEEVAMATMIFARNMVSLHQRFNVDPEMLRDEIARMYALLPSVEVH